jgi:glycosyltransferase involved in cell wall biosynthesis
MFMSAAYASESEALTVSVIVPVFNRLKYLKPAIDSVINQTMPTWELLVADDGSGPEMQAYLRSLGDHPQIKVIWMPHSGIPAAVRNAGVREAKGRFVAFMDSDDIWAKNKLEAQLAALKARSHCKWSYTAFTNVDEFGNTLPEEQHRKWTPHEGDVFDLVLQGQVSIRTPTVIATKQLLVEAGLFDDSMHSAEDYDLWLRMALRSDVAVVNESLVQVRSHREHHSADWASAYAGQDHTFRKLRGIVDQRRGSLVLRARTRNALRFAAQHAVRRNRLAVLRTLANSVSFSWNHLEWWRRSPMIVLRAFLPDFLLVAYRNCRRDNA